MRGKDLQPGNEYDLAELARGQFGSLGKGEIQLLSAAIRGCTVVCGPNEDDDDAANDPDSSAAWSSAREIRGSLIRWLFVNPLSKQCLDPRGIRIYGAKIKGGLDLSFVKTDFPLTLRRCYFDDHINLDYIIIPSVALTGSSVNSLSADFAKVTGSFRTDKGFHAKGPVQLRAAHIGGNLDCQGSRFQILDKAATLNRGIVIDAESARIDGSIRLREKFFAEGGIRLYRAQVAGNLDCDGGKIVMLEPGSSLIALNAESARIGGSVFLRSFSAQGEVRLIGTEIGGFLACDGARLENPPREGVPDSGTALQAEGITVSIAVLLWKDFYAEGAVRFFGARVKGSFVCDHATLKNPFQSNLEKSGIALNAETAEVSGYMQLRNKFSAEGMVRLYRSKLKLGLDCSDGRFENPNGVALDAYGAEIGGHVQLSRGFESKGLVLLAAAHLQGNLYCRNAKLSNPARTDSRQSGIALDADGIKVGGSLALSNGFLAEGAVRVFGAQIGQDFQCEGAEFCNPFNEAIAGTGTALNAEACRVTGSVLLRNNFRADGRVRLFGARIDGNLECQYAKFVNAIESKEQLSPITIDGTGLVVGGSLLLNNSTHNGTIRLSIARISRGLRYDKASFLEMDLRDATVGWIEDDAQSWPQANGFLLDGFVYSRISAGPFDSVSRLKWLHRQHSFKRQTYRQLADVLNAAGDDVGARRVQSEMQRRVWEDRHWITRPVSWLLSFTIGYGYFPLRSVWLLVSLVLAGSIIYSVGYDNGAIVPSNKESYTYFEEHCNPPPFYERFHSLAYSLENSFPVVKLGAQEKWVPAPVLPLTSCRSSGRFMDVKAIIDANVIRWMRWVQIGCGWILTTLFVGGVTGLLRKN